MQPTRNSVEIRSADQFLRTDFCKRYGDLGLTMGMKDLSVIRFIERHEE